MLRPANKAAEDAFKEVKGTVSITIKGGAANERRRSLYWLVCALVVPILNDLYTLTLDEKDLHDITRTKLKVYTEHILPSGEVFLSLKSTGRQFMPEFERAEYTDRAFKLWSTWTGVDVTTLKTEAQR